MQKKELIAVYFILISLLFTISCKKEEKEESNIWGTWKIHEHVTDAYFEYGDTIHYDYFESRGSMTINKTGYSVVTYDVDSTPYYFTYSREKDTVWFTIDYLGAIKYQVVEENDTYQKWLADDGYVNDYKQYVSLHYIELSK